MATRQSVREFGDSLSFLIQALVRANQEAKMKQEAEQQFRGAFNQTPAMSPSSTINVGGQPAQLQRFQGVESQPNYQMLAQLMASSNPMLAQKSANFIGGQKAIQGLQPEYRVGGGAEAGYFQYDPRNPAKSMQQLTPPRPRVEKPNLPEGFAQITDEKAKAEIYNKTYGATLSPEAFKQKPSGTADLSVRKAIADSKRTLAKSQSTIRGFESNPNLMKGYQKIVNDPEFQSAVNSQDVDLATAVLSRLLGDTTPQRILTKKYLDYIKAVNDEEGEFAYLQELGTDVNPLKRKKPQPPVNTGTKRRFNPSTGKLE